MKYPLWWSSHTTAIVSTSCLPTFAILLSSHSCLSVLSFFISSLIPLPVFEDAAWGQRRNWLDWEFLALVLTGYCARPVSCLQRLHSLLYHFVHSPVVPAPHRQALQTQIFLLSFPHYLPLFVNLLLPVRAAWEEKHAPKRQFCWILNQLLFFFPRKDQLGMFPISWEMCTQSFAKYHRTD